MIKRYLDLVLFLLWCYLRFTDGQNCVSNPDVSILGERTIEDVTQVISPSFNFSCNGRIIGITISLLRTAYARGYLPVFQVWHPLSSHLNVYSKIAQINVHDIGTRITGSHYIYNVSLNGSDQIEFESGDVIGYYQPSQSVVKVGNDYNLNYTSYYKSNVDYNIAKINISSAHEEYSKASFQPLISVMTNTQCDNNRLIANGRLTSCSSGRVGVGYEGDTCNFTCNTGYELTGSDTRTCQSNGSWSGSDDVCRRVSCPLLTNPNNGVINCSLGDDGVPSYEDTCSFTCKTGYELTGSDTRTCQSDGSWSGNDVMCSIAPKNDSNESTSQDGNNSSGSSGAAIGGAVGGILFIIIIIIVAVIVVLYIRRLQRKKEHAFEEAKSTTRDYQNIINETSEQSNGITPSSKLIYEVPDSSQNSIVNAALSSMNGTYNPNYESSGNWYAVSSPPPQEISKSIEEEEKIYNMPCEDEGNYGPVYCEPPRDEHKIYTEFEGKRFRKLYHKEIWSFGELGTGEFGTVTHCKWKPSANKEVEVAVKTLNSNASDTDRLRFLQEAAIMCQFDHQNVIKLHGVVTEIPIMIVLEYMRHGDLKNMLMQLQPMNGITAHAKLPFILLKFCKEIAAGMAYLSGKQFVHRDLAARNILVSEKIVCKIADFGMSRDLADDNYYITSGGKIPVKWTAPEALLYRKYSVQSDVWSYGCVLYEIWSLGCKPFEELTNAEVIEKVDGGYRLPPPPGCPRAIYRTMIKCWNPDPRSRPQFGQITKLLSGNIGYLLGWSDEDKWIGGENAMKLGAPLESANNLYCDLQLRYKQLQTER